MEGIHPSYFYSNTANTHLYTSCSVLLGNLDYEIYSYLKKIRSITCVGQGAEWTFFRLFAILEQLPTIYVFE
jgi:hypothetical protein